MGATKKFNEIAIIRTLRITVRKTRLKFLRSINEDRKHSKMSYSQKY